MATIIVTDASEPVVVNNGDVIILQTDGSEPVTIVSGGGQVRNFVIDYGDDPTVNQTAIIDLNSFEQVNLAVKLRNYDTDDQIVIDGAENGGIDPSDPKHYNFDFVGADGVTYDGKLWLRDAGEDDFGTKPAPIIFCFAEGTLIATPSGDIAVQEIAVGDLVNTRDHGAQPVRWKGERRFGAQDLALHPHLVPIRIPAGALGYGQPRRDLVVSPQHRVLVADWRSALLFGEVEVLVPAKALIGLNGIAPVEGVGVGYVHLLFDAHEIVDSEGLATESLHPGEVALSAIGQLAHVSRDLDTALGADGAGRRTARPVIRVSEARALCAYPDPGPGPVSRPAAGISASTAPAR